MQSLAHTFGPIDVYLFDQLLRGRIRPGMTVFDAGCGGGRNLVYLLREGYEVFGVDSDAGQVEALRELAKQLGGDGSAEQFRSEDLETMTFSDEIADLVISCAVLHFARDDEHFLSMLDASWRVLKPGGLFFCRLASSIGIEEFVDCSDGRVCRLPDGSDRYLVDQAQLLEMTERLGATLVDPIKTTNVQNRRCMTTWVLRKS